MPRCVSAVAINWQNNNHGSRAVNLACVGAAPAKIKATREGKGGGGEGKRLTGTLFISMIELPVRSERQRRRRDGATRVV